MLRGHFGSCPNFIRVGTHFDHVSLLKQYLQILSVGLSLFLPLPSETFIVL